MTTDEKTLVQHITTIIDGIRNQNTVLVSEITDNLLDLMNFAAEFSNDYCDLVDESTLAYRELDFYVTTYGPQEIPVDYIPTYAKKFMTEEGIEQAQAFRRTRDNRTSDIFEVIKQAQTAAV